MSKSKKSKAKQAQRRPLGIADVLKRDDFSAELARIAGDTSIRGVVFFMVDQDGRISVRSCGLSALEVDGVLHRLEEGF